ncbi:MAG: ATP-binding protein, partial [Asticcacaulis sp.]
MLRLLSGLVAAGALVFSLMAARDGLWANLVVGVLVAGLCFGWLVRRPLDRCEAALAPNSLPAVQEDPIHVLLDQVPMPLLRFGPDAALQTLNRAARSLFKTDDVILNAPPALMTAIIGAAPGKPQSVVLFERTYAIGVSEITSAGRVTRVVSLTNIQSELRIAEATALRDLLRVLSHEIMNSLTPVASLAETAMAYLEGELTPGARQASEALDVLTRRATSLTRFIEAYRSLSRLPDPVRQPVYIGPMLRDLAYVFEQSVKGQGITLDLSVQDQCPPLNLDETLIMQAILNILTNAAEAVTHRAGERQIRLSLEHDEQEVRILISDNGNGIAANVRDQIFHAFVTTKAGGTGTGLNLARQIALAHGGDLLWFKNDEARGTT